eukprot:scaffold357482_cov13-Prasinocladus_malaysianus.AAC.1
MCADLPTHTRTPSSRGAYSPARGAALNRPPAERPEVLIRSTVGFDSDYVGTCANVRDPARTRRRPVVEIGPDLYQANSSVKHQGGNATRRFSQYTYKLYIVHWWAVLSTKRFPLSGTPWPCVNSFTRPCRGRSTQARRTARTATGAMYAQKTPL